ncbi:hypothetical protein HRI_002686900 [Hibiscus trionum]|uniref:Reverse transcriptase n=1 Tax=Hibiscus trionum TaxID=183268 RepID=A0A9W7I7W1_HIBTR|nr:hypothetical protein HRI_002686900 [Hibiscus trionum]
MKILSWNVQGLGQPRTVGRLNQKLRDENLCIFFLIKTKLTAGRMAKVQKRCGFPNGIDVDAVGRRGGLSMGWKNSCDVTLRSYSVRHIDVVIKDDTAALEECALDDIGYLGSWFTWEKGRREQSNMRLRLDRGVANNAWWSLFPSFKLQHLQHSFSDHCPLLLHTNSSGNTGNRVWHFRFEASWLLESSCEATVSDIWQSSGDNLLEKLSQVSKGLDKWFRKIRWERNLSVHDLNQKLVQLNELHPIDGVLGDIVETKFALNLELDKKELYWEQ